MRFYKGDIVEVINYWKNGEVGKRHRITEIKSSFSGDVVIYEIGSKDKGINHISFFEENIMLYNRPFINHVKDFFVMINNLKTKSN
jgi:hypothetical protein